MLMLSVAKPFIFFMERFIKRRSPSSSSTASMALSSRLPNSAYRSESAMNESSAPSAMQ